MLSITLYVLLGVSIIAVLDDYFELRTNFPNFVCLALVWPLVVSAVLLGSVCELLRRVFE